MPAPHEIELGKLRLGAGNPLFLIAGPCVIESELHAQAMAEKVAKIAADAGVPYIFKASYDKANRSSVKAFRGPGLKEGLRILEKIKKDLKLPILTDIHDVTQAESAAEVCDILQIPAFLARQTDLLIAAGKTGRIINIKKGQFLSPWDMDNVAEKVESTGNKKIILTERGTSFGYQNLVVDMRSFPVMQRTGYPVVFDVTHSLKDTYKTFNDAKRAHEEFGFLRMWSIYPAQIQPIVDAMAPNFGEVQRASEILLAAQKASWGPIQHAGDLHDRATYRYFWELVQRAKVSGQKLPEDAERAFFP